MNSLVAIILAASGLECEAHDIGVTVANAEPGQVMALLRAVPECPPLEDLAEFVENLRTAKYDIHLPDNLLRRAWVKRNAHLRDEVTQTLRAVAG